MCKMDREIDTRPPMSDDKQVVFYVSGFLVTRSCTDGKSCSTVVLLGALFAGCESTEERPLSFSSVAENSDSHW